MAPALYSLLSTKSLMVSYHVEAKTMPAIATALAVAVALRKLHLNVETTRDKAEIDPFQMGLKGSDV